ncbi:MAG: carboxypeptidase-like regulatory domain-containing protein [Fibrobacterales bacterium]
MRYVGLKPGTILGTMILSALLTAGCSVSEQTAGVTECGNTGVTECGNTDPIAEVSSSSVVQLSSGGVSSSLTLSSSSQTINESSSSIEKEFRLEGVALYSDGSPASFAEVLVRTQDYLASNGGEPVLLQKTSTAHQGLFKQSMMVAEAVVVITDSEGRFSLSSLFPGNYNIEVNNKETHSAFQPISISADDTLITTQMTLKEYGSITGAVEVPENEQAYAKVYGLEKSVDVDEFGRFVIDDMPQGDFKIRIDFKNNTGLSIDVKDSIQLDSAEADYIETDMKYMIFSETPVENSVRFWDQKPVEFQDSIYVLGGGFVGNFPDIMFEEKKYIDYIPMVGYRDDKASLVTEGDSSLYIGFYESLEFEIGSVFFYFPNWLDSLEADDWQAQGLALRRDLRPWQHQDLVFDILTEHNMQVKVSSRENDTYDPTKPEDVDVVANIFEFGASDLWEWETVRVPLSHFTTADFSKLKVAFFIQYAEEGDVFLDNIRFEPRPAEVVSE